MPRERNNETTDFERKMIDVVKVEGTIIAFSLVAFGLLLNMISAFNQLNFELAQLPNGKFYGYVPLGPTMVYFTVMVACYVGSLSTGLISIIVPKKNSNARSVLIITSIAFITIGLFWFTWALWSLRLAFFYWVS